ncbi:MAG UNVERIFIED_CONTAM: hypothetical protein LVR18_43575 [Planctomycetaceae bacterium]
MPGAEPFGVALLARPPADWNLVFSSLGDAGLTLTGNRGVRVLVHWAGWEIEVGQEGIKESWEHPHQATFSLSFFSKKEDIVAGQKCEADIGDDGIFIPDHTREKVFTGGKHGEKVFPNLLFDGTSFPPGIAKFSKVFREFCGVHIREIPVRRRCGGGDPRDYWQSAGLEHCGPGKTVDKNRKFLVYRLHRPFCRNFLATDLSEQDRLESLAADPYASRPADTAKSLRRNFAVVAKLADAHA